MPLIVFEKINKVNVKEQEKGHVTSETFGCLQFLHFTFFTCTLQEYSNLLDVTDDLLFASL